MLVTEEWQTSNKKKSKGVSYHIRKVDHNMQNRLAQFRRPFNSIASLLFDIFMDMMAFGQSFVHLCVLHVVDHSIACADSCISY